MIAYDRCNNGKCRTLVWSTEHESSKIVVVLKVRQSHGVAVRGAEGQIGVRIICEREREADL